jgi:hypothetical protein
MFSISKTSFQHLGAEDKNNRQSLGTDSRRQLLKASSKLQSTSNLSDAPLDGTKVNNNLAIELDLNPLLYNLGPGQSEESLYRVYRDMYLIDPVAGSCADLMSNMPFSDFNLGGIAAKDKKIEQVFQDTLERLNVKTLLPESALDYLVMGKSTQSILINSSTKQFVDFMVHDPESVKVQKIPFYSQDPILTVKFSKELQKILTSTSDRIQDLKATFGNEIFDKINSGELELDPLSTIHVPRKTSPNSTGVSWFHRVLPIYLFEKNLYRGTLVESARRQRGIMHITVGDGDEWQPTPADFEYISELFTNADADPLGAIVTTRPGIMTEEIRQGGDFWKITDVWDSTLNFKLRALGVSEAFLSGDATIDTSNAGMMVFLEQLKAFRDNHTKRFFYQKLFPLISFVNGYTVKQGKIKIDDALFGSVGGNLSKAHSIINNSGQLLVPTVQWAKHFKPEGDSGYMDILKTLTEAGVPVPIRAMAAAGGFNIDKLLIEQEDDFEMRDRIGQLNQRLAEIKAKYAPAEGAGGESESAEMLANVLADSSLGKNKSSTKKRGTPSLTERFSTTSDDSEITTVTRTGKKKMVHNQVAANAKANNSILKAAKQLASNNPAL